MLADYLNQTAQHAAQTGFDDRGQTTYAPAVAVACRRQKKALTGYTENAQTRTQRTVYYLTDAVREGDTLDGCKVLGVDTWAGLGGQEIGYKAVV
ncbi:MAG: hypothetical protein LBN05_08990 [Oscillospiraceae bacterium]|jgi:hypothetical protein|nr:hypothetical protein [Oscillospiraceae bacterium]